MSNLSLSSERQMLPYSEAGVNQAIEILRQQDTETKSFLRTKLRSRQKESRIAQVLTLCDSQIIRSDYCIGTDIGFLLLGDRTLRRSLKEAIA